MQVQCSLDKRSVSLHFDINAMAPLSPKPNILDEFLVGFPSASQYILPTFQLCSTKRPDHLPFYTITTYVSNFVLSILRIPDF